MGENLTLDKALQAYRVMNTPTKLSWKQHWAQETFSELNAMKCSDDERKQFAKRLRECNVTICSDKFKTKGDVRTLEDLVVALISPQNKNLVKDNRKVVYSTSNGDRPIGSNAFEIWNGFQVIDLDIKNREISTNLKQHLFNKLYKFNWFMGIALSSSGAGLHVYTKITIPKSDEDDSRKKKLLYLTNFRHKYSFVYLALVDGMSEFGYCKDDILKWMDLMMFKPQQGAFIGYDPNPLINSHFFEDFIYVNFDNVEEMGHPNID